MPRLLGVGRLEQRFSLALRDCTPGEGTVAGADECGAGLAAWLDAAAWVAGSAAGVWVLEPRAAGLTPGRLPFHDRSSRSSRHTADAEGSSAISRSTFAGSVLLGSVTNVMWLSFSERRLSARPSSACTDPRPGSVVSDLVAASASR